VNFVPKNLNPANVPKVRPIEDFWGLLNQKVYENDWKAKIIQQLKKTITWCLFNINKKKYRMQLEAPIKDLIL
jgi:predicted P-loop ATPase/GTPase